MIYPENFETKIGFDRIRQLLADNCLSPMGRKQVDAIRFSSDAESISFRISATFEFQQLLTFEDYFPSEHYFDISVCLNKIRVIGSFPEVQEVFDLKGQLRPLKLSLYFSKRRMKKIILS